LRSICFRTRHVMFATSASARAVICPHQGRAFRRLLLDGLRRPPRAIPLLPCGSACSRRTAAPPAPRVTSLHTVVLYVVQLLVVVLHSFSFSCCRSRVCFGLAEIAPSHARTACALGPRHTCCGHPSSTRTPPRWPQLHLRLRCVPALLATRASTLLRRHQPRLPALLLHRARAACIRSCSCSSAARGLLLHCACSSPHSGLAHAKPAPRRRLAQCPLARSTASRLRTPCRSARARRQHPRAYAPSRAIPARPAPSARACSRLRPRAARPCASARAVRYRLKSALLVEGEERGVAGDTARGRREIGSGGRSKNRDARRG
jgi:hypothetical protein